MMFLDANARARALRAGQKERVLEEAIKDVSSRPMPSGRGTGRPKKRQNRENSASSKSVVTKKKSSTLVRDKYVVFERTCRSMA